MQVHCSLLEICRVYDRKRAWWQECCVYFWTEMQMIAVEVLFLVMVFVAL